MPFLISPVILAIAAGIGVTAVIRFLVADTRIRRMRHTQREREQRRG